MNCTCYGFRRESFGFKNIDGNKVCNYCEKPYSLETVEKVRSQSTNVGLKSESNLRLDGINSIIIRMWIWIGAQAIFIGVWAGNAFPNVEDGYYETEVTFSFGMFLVGVIAGVGAFAPLVFVVEALRQVIINLIKGPESAE